ncbi:hypothetical protein L3Q82_008220 [Scortum barcoo]|uniref:Uncharacterized protein n=1 Tax=Scortum barcoo TaxID=214431 RepID=A0ACB8WIQ9_9TELE|nr:hypothetical protein L3Q82_008220 [Scortum barcoo]
MGDAQSAQREGNKDAAAAEESGKVEDAHTEQNTEDKPLKNNAEISEINGKADKSIAGVNGHCEDEIAAEAILSQEVSETEKPSKEEDTPFENVDINEKESPNESDANEEVPLEMIEIDAKQNDINESFRRFFSNIGLKLTVRKGSSELATDVPNETNKEEPDRPEDIAEDAKETKSENAEHSTDVNIAQEICDNDSTTCPTLTDATSEDVLENADEKTTETKEETESDHANAATTLPVKQDTHQNAMPEEEPRSTSPSSPEEEVVSPIKRFFTTGIFSGLRKKKKPAENETTEKELVNMGKKEEEVTTEETVQDQQDKEITLGVDAAAVETEHKENELKEEILSSQEKDKIQASPLKRLLSGSSLKKGSKKQRGRKSSDAKLSDSGEHVSDQLLSSTESAKNLKEEGPTQPAADVAGEEDGAWASFKKLVTPKKRIKRPSLSNEETQIPDSVEEPKPSDGEQISDHSTEEGKKRKDSSVSWEAVLCGSGRRRSRKTSDSEDESPQIDNNDIKQDRSSKHGAESPLESSNDNESETLAASPKQAGSPSEGEGGSTWKSFKKLVTPKRKAKDEDESKETIQSDGEVCQDESSFSIKKLLPGRKKRKSVEKQDQVSSDEADRDIGSGDEDSETPAVVPLSEFDTAETEVHIQTQADIESHIPVEADYELQQDLQTHVAESVLPCDSLQTEAKKVQDSDISEKQESTTPTSNEEPDDLTESTTKHQQLSDIPEEGLITETPASVNEEAARDDTIADDLIEITSEAFTAPEPLDITQADETEMISAVSQLSTESSKTSGNATPVPAEYDIVETDVLLHQVVETISPSPQAVQVCSDNLSAERIVSSASPQIMETFVKEEHTILETHRRSDATAINTGLNVEELDATNELVATVQTESIFEVNDSVSTEIVSEVPTEEFDTAEIAVDEVHEVSVTHTEESIEEKELKRIDESHHPVECLSEDVSTDILPKGEEIVTDEGSLVEEHQAGTEPTKTDLEETDRDDVVGDKTKDEALKQDVQSLTEMENEIMHNITDEIQVEDQDQPPAQAEKLQDLADVQAEVNVEPEKEDDLEKDAAKTEHVQVEESLDTVQISMLDSEEASVQSTEEGVKSEDIPQEETATDEPKQIEEHLTKVKIVSEVPTEEFDTAEIAEDEVHEVSVTHTEESIEEKDLKRIDESHHPVECLSENVSTDILPKGEEIVTDEGSLVEEHQAETEPTKTDLEETDRDDVVGDKTKDEALKQDVQSLTEMENEIMHNITDEIQVEDQDQPPAQAEKLQDSADVQAEVNVEPEKEDDLEKDAAKTEHVQVEESLDTVQISMLDSEEASVQSPEEGVKSEDIPQEETATDEPKQTEEHLTKVSVEPENKELPLEKEESVQSLENEVTSEDVPEAETVKEVNLEPTDASEIGHIQEVLQAVQAATLDSEGDRLLSVEKEVIQEDIPTVENIIDEPKQENEVRIEPEEELPVEAIKAEPEVLPAVVTDNATETKSEEEAETGSIVQELERKILLEDVPKPATSNVIASVTDEIEGEVVAQLDKALELKEDQKTETEISGDVEIEKEDCIPEVVDEIQKITAVHVTSVNEEACDVQVLEKTVFTEETPAPSKDNAAFTDEPKHEAHLGVVQVSVEEEKEKELPGTEIRTATVEHAIVAQVVTCNLKEVTASIPDILIEKTSEIIEPLIDTVANKLKIKEEVEVAIPIVKDNMAETAEEGSVVVMVHAPSVEHGDNHQIQVQVVDTDIKSAETIVESVLELGVTEHKEVIDVCLETVKKVDNLSATAETEDQFINEENEVTIQEVIQHVKENLPETVHKSVDVNLEQVNQPDTVTDVSEMVESKSKEVEDQKAMEQSIQTTMERQDEAPAVISEDSATEQQVSKELMQTPDTPGSSDVTIHDHKEDLEETKAEWEKSETDVTAEEFKSSSELVVKKSHEQVPMTQVTPSPLVPPSNTGLVVPQNTGIISSIGNVESPSSLSLEFKLNIHFGQTKAPVYPSPTTETSERVKQTEVSDVGVQAIEELTKTERSESQKQTEATDFKPVTNVDSTERAVVTTPPVLLDVGIQAMETVETAEQSKPTEKVISNVQTTETIQTVRQTEEIEVSLSQPPTEVPAEATQISKAAPNLFVTQPVLQKAAKQAMETAEPAEQIKPTESVTSSVHATEIIQPARPTEKGEVFLSQPVLSEALNQDTKAEESIKQTEEENDQDVWMDAEEIIYTQEETEVFLLEVEKPLEPQKESEEAEIAGLEHEVEMVSISKTEEEESQQEVQKVGGICEIDSEGEDFTVALEHPDTATASVTTMEWD